MAKKEDKRKKTKKQHKKTGRPGLLDKPELVDKLKYAFSIGCNTSQACIFAEVSRDAFYDAVNRDSEFADKISKLKQNPIIKAKQTVFNDLSNPKTARWYLEKKAANEFKSSHSIDLNTPKIIDDIQENNK